jgi:lysophospholipase L1-like esterase
VGDSEAGATFSAIRELLPYGHATLTYESGSRIEKWSRGKMAASSPKSKVDVIIIFLGANNYYDSRLPSTEGILRVIERSEARCIWVGPPKIGGLPWKLDSNLRESLEGRCSYVSSQDLEIELRDGIHPSIDGAKFWASKIVETLDLKY